MNPGVGGGGGGGGGVFWSKAKTLQVMKINFACSITAV